MTVLAFAPTTAAAALPGDLNGDSKLNLADLRVMIYMLVGQIPPDVAIADLNGDGNLTLRDVQALIGLIFAPPAQNADYVLLADQRNTTWYLSLSSLLDPTTAEATLSLESPGGEALNSSQPWAWFQWQLPDGGLYYVFPSSSGELVMETASPALGSGTTTHPLLKDRAGQFWQFGLIELRKNNGQEDPLNFCEVQ